MITSLSSNNPRFGFKNRVYRLGNPQHPEEYREAMLAMAKNISKYVQHHGKTFETTKVVALLPVFAIVHYGGQQADIIGLNRLFKPFHQSIEKINEDRHKPSRVNYEDFDTSQRQPNSSYRSTGAVNAAVEQLISQMWSPLATAFDCIASQNWPAFIQQQKQQAPETIKIPQILWVDEKGNIVETKYNEDVFLKLCPKGSELIESQQGLNRKGRVHKEFRLKAT